jgi:hypothetical protein
MPANKYKQAARLIGAALIRVNPQQDPELWNILKALKSLVVELQAKTNQIEVRLDRLEGGAQKKD